MPEGHVIHRLARQLNTHFAGQSLRVTSPQGRFAAEAAALDETRLREAFAWGKHLFLDFVAPDPHHIVHIHLGLIGSFRLEDYSPDAPWGQVRLHIHKLTDEHQAAEEEGAVSANLRGPQWCRLITEPEMEAEIAKLGADPLRPSDPLNLEVKEQVFQRLSRSRRSISSLLMDQKFFAGVGNIYRAEVLFRLGINPETWGSEASERKEEIWEDLVNLMAYGEDHGRIDTVREQHQPEAMGRAPRVDDHGGEVYVYRRAGQPCLICGENIAHSVVEGRNLFWCPKCQR